MIALDFFFFQQVILLRETNACGVPQDCSCNDMMMVPFIMKRDFKFTACLIGIEARGHVFRLRFLSQFQPCSCFRCEWVYSPA